EKNWQNPLLGDVCLLTTGVLIRVRRGRDSDAGVATTGTALLPLHRRLNVGVDTEEIRWVILVLEGNQPGIGLRAVRILEPLLGVLGKRVDVDAAMQAGLDRSIEFARPLHIAFRFGWVFPRGQH